MPLAHNANSLLYEHAPQIMERIRRRGDEIVGHGRANSEILHDFRWEADEARVIRKVTETFARDEGKPSQGMDERRCLRESLDAGLVQRGGLRLHRGLAAR